jgi:hypothetical protein
VDLTKFTNNTFIHFRRTWKDNFERMCCHTGHYKIIIFKTIEEHAEKDVNIYEDSAFIKATRKEVSNI